MIKNLITAFFKLFYFFKNLQSGIRIIHNYFFLESFLSLEFFESLESFFLLRASLESDLESFFFANGFDFFLESFVLFFFLSFLSLAFFLASTTKPATSRISEEVF